MSTTAMHFGPEWMRIKSQPLLRSQLEPCPPVNPLPQVTLATYSALVSVTPIASKKLDKSHPFRYSKEELLSIYQDGGGKGGLGLEVDRWEGVVREIATEPVTLREMTDAEKKLFAGSLNSEIRRRPSQSMDHFAPVNASLERHRMMPGGSVTGTSPLRERFGVMKRKDSAGGTADLSSTSMPRKSSISTPQVPGELSQTSRTRVGYSPNFDGVLNNGDSWVARRRFSETSMKPSNSSGSETQAEDSALKPGGIAEMKEEDSGLDAQFGGEDGTFLSLSPAGMNPMVSTRHSEITKNTTENLTLTGSLPTTYYDCQETRQSPVLLDLAAVEWSYQDPTGQVQGPFRADLMQKWYEEGYFTPDLPMKRTHLDSQWSIVRELVAQATSASVFLTPPFPAAPPGLSHQLSLRAPEHIHTERFQPAPIQSLHTSTLESSLTGVFLASDSPSSSFGASQFGNSSPDQSSFIGRDKRPYSSIEADGRISNFGLQDLPNSSATGTCLSNNKFVHDLSAILNKSPPIVHDSWAGLQNSSFGIRNADLIASPGLSNNASVAKGFGFDLGGSKHLADFGGPQSGSILPNPVNYVPNHELDGTIPFTGLVSQQPYAPQLPYFNHQHGQTPSLESTSPHASPIPNGLPSGRLPWTIPKPGIQTSVSTLDANDGLSSDAIIGAVSDETSAAGLSVDAGGQQNAPQELLVQRLDEKLPVFDQDSGAAPASITTFASPPASEHGKLSTKTAMSVPNPPLDQVASADDSVSQAPAKSAWAKDDDGKGKRGTTTSISLRAIQEAEAKRQQSLKATDRGKERAARPTITSDAKEDLQSFTTSWGLPTSQAGTRGNIHTPAKDLPVPSAAPNQPSFAAPVWTTASKNPVVKKTMKEIQEEEEKRKWQVTKDCSVTTTSKRPFAETTSKTTPIPAALSNTNPWATVGPNGKLTFPAQPSRAPAYMTSFSSAVSGPSAASRSAVSPNQRISTTSPTKMRPVTKPGEVPEAPSLEFLKWLGEALKGLNSSANIEEIMSMLFSFPLDPDASTLEIISDTIYANSTTLDGRRFAADFVAKRKADADRGRVESGKAPANKPVSIADVVKAVPKSTQPEWGFKVVNKKKKGGRP